MPLRPGDEQRRWRIRRVAVFLTAACLQALSLGLLHALPLFLLTFSRALHLTQLETNGLGVVVFASIAVGVPLATLLRRLLTFQGRLAEPVLCSTLSLLAITLLYLASEADRLHLHVPQLAVAGGFFFLASAYGVYFSYASAVLLQPRFLGPRHGTLISAMLNSSNALGGVCSGCLYYYIDSSLQHILLLLLIAQAVINVLCLLVFAAVTRVVREEPEIRRHEIDVSAAMRNAVRPASRHSSAALNSPSEWLLGPGSDGDETTDESGDEGGDRFAAAGTGSGAGAASSDRPAATADGDLARPADLQGMGSLQAPPEHARPTPPSLWAYFLQQVRTFEYWSVALVFMLVVGIGGTKVTTLPSSIEATLAASDPSQRAIDNVSFAVVVLNLSQVFGRLLVTLVLAQGRPVKPPKVPLHSRNIDNSESLNSLGGEATVDGLLGPQVSPRRVLALHLVVALLFGGICLADRLWFSLNCQLVLSGPLGLAYGMMLSLSTPLSQLLHAGRRIMAPHLRGGALLISFPWGAAGLEGGGGDVRRGVEWKRHGRVWCTWCSSSPTFFFFFFFPNKGNVVLNLASGAMYDGEVHAGKRPCLGKQCFEKATAMLGAASVLLMLCVCAHAIRLRRSG